MVQEHHKHVKHFEGKYRRLFEETEEEEKIRIENKTKRHQIDLKEGCSQCHIFLLGKPEKHWSVTGKTVLTTFKSKPLKVYTADVFVCMLIIRVVLRACKLKHISGTSLPTNMHILNAECLAFLCKETKKNTRLYCLEKGRGKMRVKRCWNTLCTQ